MTIEQIYYNTIDLRTSSAVSAPARLEQLAEECVELAHAALKVARIIRDENPTSADLYGTWTEITEEATDVVISMLWAGVKTDGYIARDKIERLNQRVTAKEGRV